MKPHFTDVETEVWGGHSASPRERGIKAGSHPNLGGMQSPHYLIPLRQSLLQEALKETHSSYLTFFQVGKERPERKGTCTSLAMTRCRNPGLFVCFMHVALPPASEKGREMEKPGATEWWGFRKR